MTKLSQQPEQGANDINADHQAERDHLADPRISEKLIRLSLRAIRTGIADSEDEKLTQMERVLLRACAGKGSPVILPDIQRPGARKFISDVAARIWTLRHIYGFLIQCKWWLEDGQKMSVYWITLAQDGSPKMLPVKMRAIKTGKPSAAHAEPEKHTATNTLKGDQVSMFGPASGPGAIAL